MVKLQDGSLVIASRLLSGEAEDQDGNKLDFKAEQDKPEFYKAEHDVTDGSGRKNVYSFDIGETLVKVSVATIQADKDKDKDKLEQQKTKASQQVEPEPDDKDDTEKKNQRLATQTATSTTSQSKTRETGVLSRTRL